MQLKVYGIFFLGWCLRKWLRGDIAMTDGRERRKIAELSIFYFIMLTILDVIVF